MNQIKAGLAESRAVKFGRWINRLFHLGGIAAILWSIAIWIAISALRGETPPVREATPGDFEALLFGASSVALIIFSVVIGVIAFVGYDRLKKDTAAEVQAATRERIDKLEKDLRGRVSLVIGLILGIIHSTPDEQAEEERVGYLAEAVKHCERAYVALSEIDNEMQYTALNNLVYYSCALGKGYKKEFLLSKAEELRAFSQEISWWEGLLTYCKAISDLCEDHRQVEGAYRIASSLLTENLTDRQRNEATIYVASLRKKREQRTGAERSV